MLMLERYAYANRWRWVSPGAKGLFALCGLTAVFLAGTPRVAGGLALALALVTLVGTGISPGSYLRVAAPALLFLATSVVSLMFSLKMDAPSGPSLQLVTDKLPQVAAVCTRSLGGLAALLFLSLSTPMNDIIALLRRLRTPETLLDLMTLCYRMLFVFSESVHDMRTAQAARLGNATRLQALRSLGVLAANLVLQVWQRSLALQHAALSRNNDGPLRFMEPSFPQSGANLAVSVIGGGSLILVAMVMR